MSDQKRAEPNAASNTHVANGTINSCIVNPCFIVDLSDGRADGPVLGRKRNYTEDNTQESEQSSQSG